MPARSPEARARLDDLRKRIYEDRKVRQVCVHCEGELGPDDGVQCAACVELTAPRAAKWRASARGKKTRRKNQTDYIMRRYNAGLCVLCCTPREQWEPPSELAIKRAAATGKTSPPRNCPTCAREHAEYQKKRNELKRQGVTDIADARRKKAAADKVARGLKARAELEDYEPIDELLVSTKYRLLAAAARFVGEWITAAELLDAVGIAEYDADDRTERDRYTKALERFRKAGLIRYRTFHEAAGDRMIRAKGSRNGGDYQITTKGREELAELRAKLAKGAAL